VVYHCFEMLKKHLKFSFVVGLLIYFVINVGENTLSVFKCILAFIVLLRGSF